MTISIGTIEGTIRLRDEFTSRLQASALQLEKHGKRMDKVGRQMSDIGGKLTRSLTLPILAVGAGSIKLASDFESSFAGVRKTVNATEDVFAELSRGMRDLSKEIPVNVNELNRIGEAAGQLGIETGNILSFTRVMADLGVATNLSSDQAATSLARLANITRLPQTEFDRLGSTIVELGNNFATTEAEIVEMGLRIAGAGKQIGLTEGQILAVGTALSSVGIEAEAGGSAISKVMINIALASSKGGAELQQFARVAGMSSQEFQAAFREDAASAVNEFVQGLGRMNESGGDVLGTLDAMGITEVRMRDALLRASGAGDLLTRALDLQAVAWEENNALTNEAAQRYKTFESQLTLFWNRLKDVGITLGTALLPVLRDVLDDLAPLIDKAAAAAEAFGRLPKPVQATALALATAAAAAGPALAVAGGLTAAWGAVAGAAPAIVAALTRVLAVVAGPAGWTAAAVATLVAWRPVREFLVDLGQRAFAPLREWIGVAVEFVGRLWDAVRPAREVLGEMAGFLGQVAGSFAVVGRTIRDQLLEVWTELFEDSSVAGWRDALSNALESIVQHVGFAARAFREWWDRTEEGRRFLIDLARVIASDVAEAISTVIGWARQYVEWQIRSTRAAYDAIVSFVQWTGVLDIARLAVSRVVLTLEVLWGWLKKTFDRLVTWADSVGGWARVVGAFDPILGAVVGKLGEWAAEARKNMSASKEAASAADDLAVAAKGVAEAAGEAGVGGGGGGGGGLPAMTDALADALKGMQASIITQEALRDSLLKGGDAYEVLNALLDEGVPLADALSGAYDDLGRSLLQSSAELESWINLREKEVEHAERVLELEREINRAYLDRAARAASPTSIPIPTPDLEQAEVDWSEFVEQIDQEWRDGVGRMSAELQAVQEQAWRNVQDIAADAIAEVIKTGELDFKSLFDSVLDVVAQMLSKMLIMWVANLAKRVAAEQSAAAASAAAWAAAGSGGGGGGSGTSMYGVDWWQVAGAASKGGGSGGGWFSSMFGGGVGGASWSTLGVMFGTAAAAVIIAELGNDWIQGQQQKLTAGTIGFGPQGAEAFSGQVALNDQMVAAMEALGATFREIEDLTGANIEILDQVRINVKGTGRIWVNIGDWFTREVDSLEEALDLVVTQLVQRSEVTGGSPAVRASLENFAGSTIDSLQEDIAAALRSEELFLGMEGRSAFRERTREFFELLGREIELGIIEAQGGSGALRGLVSTYQDSFDQLMGIQRDAADQARMDARAHNAALLMDIARLQALKAETLALGAAAQAAGGFAETVGIGAKVMHAGTIATGGLAQATALSSRSQGAMAEVLLAGADAAAVNAEAQGALAGTQAAGASVASAAAQANLAALQAIDEALALLAGLEVDIEAAAAAARRASSGRGTRRSDLEQLSDLLDQMSFDRALAGMTALEAGRERLARQYEEEARRAHGNAELIAQLAEEYAFLNAELTKQIQLAAVDTFQSFLGIGEDPFSALRIRWEEARAAVEEAGFGAERTARMLGRLDAAMDAMLDTLSREELVGLGDTLGGILETYYGNVEGFEQFRIDVERMRFEAEMINARARFEILKAEGTIAAAVLARMQEVFDFIDANPIDWAKFVAPAIGGGSGGSGVADAARERENALRQLREIQARSLSPLMQAIRGVVDTFAELRRTLGWTAEVQAAYAQEIQRVLTAQLEPIKRLQEELAFRAGSSMRTIDQFRLAQRQANEAQAALAAGDLSQLDRIPDLVRRVLDLNPNAQAGEETRFLEAWAQQFLGQAQVLAEDAVMGIVPGSPNDPFNWLRVTPTAGDDAVVAAIRDLGARQDRTTDAIRDSEEANEILRKEERIRRSAETLNAAKNAERDAKRDALLGQIRDRVGASKQSPGRDAITLSGIR